MPADSGPTHERRAVAPPVPTAAQTAPAPAAPVGGLVPVAGLAVGLRRRSAVDDPLGGTTAPADVAAALSRRQGHGRELEPEVAERMGAAMGADFSGVRVHDDGEADRIARSVQATAFTAGSDVYFTRGTYDPGTARGERLLGHELAHVVQGTSGATSAGGPVIGRADDPAEAAADAMADRAITRMRRQTARVAQTADETAATRQQVDGQGTAGPEGLRRQAARMSSTTIRRDPPSKVADDGTTTKPTGQEATPEPAKTPKQLFEEACAPQTAPASKTVAKARLDALRQLINTFDGAGKKSIADDSALMAKGRAHLGDLYYMGLLAAVDMSKKKTKSDGSKVDHHLTGAEADQFIQTNINDYPHIKPFIAAAAGAGKKGEGYVASVSPEDWAVVYAAQYPGDSVAEEQSTNAYVGNKIEDRPAMLHADRGTPSTAIHESMHRYSELAVLRTIGSGLNEGITEYFTRMLSDRDAKPAKDGGPERNNYDKNVQFVRGMIRILGANQIEQETVLGEIYFEGKVEKLKAKFQAAWKAKGSTLTQPELDAKWDTFEERISDGAWAQANALLPPP